MKAEIVVIGGGAVGCGAAYSLAMAGKRDVLLVEKEPHLAAATTPQAAGLVGQVRNSVERTQLAMWSVETFSRLQQNEQVNPGWRQVGSLRIALCEERVREFQHMQAVADEAGLEARFIDNHEAKRHWPAMDFSRVKAALWCPTDGYLQPSDLAMSYVHHARQQGVRFHTNTAVKQVIVDQGRVRGVETSQGTIECDTVVNAAGAHAYHIARSVGVELPIVPVRHEYFITVEAQGLDPSLPVVRIPDSTLYLRAETNALLCGGWEPKGMSVAPSQFGIDEDPPPIVPDWDVLGEFAAQLEPEIPQVSELGIRSVFKGWPTFTPDGRFIIGETSQVQGFFMAGGCNAHGVSGSAGIGRHLVESMLQPEPSSYVRSLSPNRFLQQPWQWESAQNEARHYYETYYCLGH
jgi:glycine/D-amino acid oxidase-like deaminating enzyme